MNFSAVFSKGCQASGFTPILGEKSWASKRMWASPFGGDIVVRPVPSGVIEQHLLHLDPFDHVELGSRFGADAVIAEHFQEQ